MSGTTQKLLDLAVDRPVATCMLLLSLMVLGTVSIFRLPLDFLPSWCRIHTTGIGTSSVMHAWSRKAEADSS